MPPRPEVTAWWRREGARELRELLNAWDPIGVYHLDPPWSPDEYDPYLAPVFDALCEDETPESLQKALSYALDRMGLGPAGDREAEFAERIVRWWRRSSPRP